MATNSLGNSKRIAKNTLMLYMRMLVSMAVGFFTSRIVLQALGVVDYGVYSLVGSAVVLFSFLNNALSTATKRYLTIEVGREDDHAFHHVFRVSLTAHLIIAIAIFILVEIIGYYLLNHKLIIPEERLSAANIVLHFSTLAYLIKIIKIPFESTIIANERMSFYAWLTIIEVLQRLAVALLLLYVLQDRLVVYSILLFLSAVITFSVYVMYCKTQFQCKTRLIWDRKLTREMLSFSGWELIGSGARTIDRQGFIFALNIYAGVVANAAIGIANQVSNLVSNFVSNFQIAFNPQITKYYATEQYQEMFNLSFRTAKFSFCLLFLCCLPLMADMDYYLVLWLQNPPEMSSAFCTVIFVIMMIDAVSAPLWMMIFSNGEIAKYQILLSMIVLSGAALSIFLLSIGVRADYALCGRIVEKIAILIFRLFFLRNKLSYPLRQYAHKVMMPIVILAGCGICCFLLIKQLDLYPLINSILLFLFTSFIIWTFALDKQEKHLVLQYVLRRVR